jgi:Spy/CpxP family protein refolding chaperone
MKMTVRNSIVRVIVLALGVSALGILQARAQDQPPPPPPPGQGGPGHGAGMGMRGNNVEFLTKRLNLTPDQVTQVKAIDDDTQKQSKAIMDDTTLAQPDKRAKMMDLHKTAQGKIRALLTPDQQKQYDALQEEMRQRMQNRGGPGGPPPPPQPPSPPQL